VQLPTFKESAKTNCLNLIGIFLQLSINFYGGIIYFGSKLIVMLLNLNKQKLSELSDDQLSNTRGGGEARSDRRTGNCAFSRKTGTTYDQCGDPTGCYPPCSTW
jgi:hypothetical protein